MKKSAFHQITFFRQRETIFLNCNQWKCLNEENTTEVHNMHCFVCYWNTHKKRDHLIVFYNTDSCFDTKLSQFLLLISDKTIECGDVVVHGRNPYQGFFTKSPAFSST